MQQAFAREAGIRTSSIQLDSPTGFDPAQVEALAGLMRACFPLAKHLHTPELSTRYLRWLYVENPCGRVIAVNACREETLIGHYALVPLRWRRDDAVVTAALSLNTCVHPDHRGKGLFAMLAGAAYEEAARRGVDFVYGVANAQSTTGFIKHLGFDLLGPLNLQFVGPATVVAGTAIRSRPRYAADDGDIQWQWRLGRPTSAYRLYREGVRARAPIVPAGIWSPKTGLAGQESAATAGPLSRFGLYLGARRLARGRDVPRSLRPRPLNLIYRCLGQEASAVPVLDDFDLDFLDFDLF